MQQVPQHPALGVIQNAVFTGSWTQPGAVGFYVTNGTGVTEVEPFRLSATAGDRVTFTRGRICGMLGQMYGLSSVTVDQGAVTRVSRSVNASLPAELSLKQR